MRDAVPAGMQSGMRPGVRSGVRPIAPRAAALLATAVLAGLALAGGVGPRAQAAPAPALAAAPASTPTPAFEQTRTLTREHLEPDGSTVRVDTRDVTVAVDVTTDLQNRERIAVSWRGAHPTGGRTGDPYGANGLGQEYPVVILQCRGVEDPAPGGEAISPETCWTTSRNERNGSQSMYEAVWAHDRYADPARVALGGSAAPWPAACEPDDALLRNYLVPFRTAKGKVYWQCAPGETAPEQATDAALPANDVFAATAPDGTGRMLVEVRTTEVNESLGCSDTVPCSLVVIPIMGISCTDAGAGCREDGIWAPGTIRSDSGDGYDKAVAGDFWWSASNWRNRFTVPLTFAPSPRLCDLLDSRTPVSFYGSELLAQASLQWAPAYCLDPARFKFQHNRSSEALARRQLGTANAVAAFVSDPLTGGPLQVAYAPTAVTGFGIGFVVDKRDNAGEVASLRLTPRLLAKLLTESYPATPGLRDRHCDVSGDAEVEVLRASDVPARDAVVLPLPDGACEIRTTSTRTQTVNGAEEEVAYVTIAQGSLDLAGNPLTITTDPEFTALNPDVPARQQVSEAVLLTLSEEGDVTRALTSWIAADPAAAAFVAGEPDEHGMRVNGYYKGLSLPLGDWPLLDRYVQPANQACIAALSASTPDLSRFASPVNSLKKTSEALLDAWPYSQVSASNQGAGTPCRWDRPRLSFGARFMLAVVPLADADRLGLRVAALGSGAGSFQPPTDETMAAALASFRQAGPGQAFAADYTAMSPDAYPGTMVVHTAAQVQGLAAAQAADVAAFIRVATTEGQVRGRSTGELPAGYLPLLATGPTAPLFAAAQLAATAIGDQDPTLLAPPAGTPTPAPQGPPTFAPAPTGSAPRPALPGSAAPAAAAPAQVPGLPAVSEGRSAATVSVLTPGDRSSTAGVVIPVLLAVVLAGAAGAPAVRGLAGRRLR